MQHATALGWLVAHLDDSITIYPEKDILGSSTPSENRQQNLQMMTDSKETAAAVALSRLGYDVAVTGTGAVVVGVGDGTDKPVPATGVLSAGDTIVSVGATPVTKSDELVAAIGTHQPGDTVELGVQPYKDDGSRTTETRSVTLGARSDDPTKAFLGVSSSTRDLDYHLPFDVVGRLGSGRWARRPAWPSPSASWTCSRPTRSPAVTRSPRPARSTPTVRSARSGGVHQKTIAVRDSGAELFLVPSSEYDEAEKYAGSLRVEKVDTVDDALQGARHPGRRHEGHPACHPDRRHRPSPLVGPSHLRRVHGSRQNLAEAPRSETGAWVPSARWQ